MRVRAAAALAQCLLRRVVPEPESWGASHTHEREPHSPRGKLAHRGPYTHYLAGRPCFRTGPRVGLRGSLMALTVASASASAAMSTPSKQVTLNAPVGAPEADDRGEGQLSVCAEVAVI